jgi:hypothetical protein
MGNGAGIALENTIHHSAFFAADSRLFAILYSLIRLITNVS